jgi:hypothetical protein
MTDDLQLPPTPRDRFARPVALIALVFAAHFWSPAFLSPERMNSYLSLMGFLPFPSASSTEPPLALWWIPVSIFCAFVSGAWFFRSRTLAIYALLMPFAGFLAFWIRFAAGMSASR